MNKTDVVKMFAVIKAAYPSDPAFQQPKPDMVTVWAEMLSDIPYERIGAALKAHISSSPFPPKISDIRGWATVKVDNTGEAWGLVKKAIRDYGYWQKEAALASLPDEVRRIVVQLGWESLCTSENEMADRAHFLKVYQAYQERENRYSALPDAVRMELQSERRKELTSG